MLPYSFIMNKKYLTISVGLLIIFLSLLSGFFWYMKTSNNSNNQAWATYTQRLDSGDVISIDYPTRLAPQAYQVSPEEKLYISTTTNDHVRDIRFQSPDSKTLEYIDVIQNLPKSQTEIEADKKSFEVANENEIRQSRNIDTKPSRWHLDTWTAYETSVPSDNYLYDFNINGRGLTIQLSVFSDADIERVLSSIRLNDIQMSKFDSVKGWDWPSIKTGK